MVLRNALFVLLFPVLMLLTGLAAVVVEPMANLPVPMAVLAGAAPYALCLFAGLVGAWFERPRVVLMAALVLGAHWVVQTFVAGTNIYAREPGLTVVYAAVAVLFPLNALLFAFKADRGLLSQGMVGRVLLLVLQVAALTVVWDGGDLARQAIDDLTHVRVFDENFDVWTLLPQPALILFVLVSLGLLVRAVYSGGVLDGGLFGAVAASGLALHSAGDGALSAALFTLAGVALLVCVAQEGYRLAFLDELTGLPGRRALMHDLNAQNGAYAVAMLDVDHFKKFNDTYGHDVGDQVLKMVAGQMLRVSGGGRAYRYGGEEFTVLFPRRDVRHALAHLEKLRAAIEKAAFKLRGEDRPDIKPTGVKPRQLAKLKAARQDSVSVTVSIGVAQREDEQEPSEALKAADQALYRAKDGGRNRVQAAGH